MWRDICLANGEAIVAMLDRFATDLESMKTAIRAGDGETLLARFQAAKQARDGFTE